MKEDMKTHTQNSLSMHPRISLSTHLSYSPSLASISITPKNSSATNPHRTAPPPHRRAKGLSQNVLTSNTQIKSNRIKIPLPSRQTPPIPPQPIRPINQIQMTNMIQRPLVVPPPTTAHTHQSIISALDSLNHAMRSAEEGEEVGVGHRGAVAVVFDSGDVGGSGVEGLGHVGLG